MMTKANRNAAWTSYIAFGAAMILAVHAYVQSVKATNRAIEAERMSINVLNTMPLPVIACTSDDRVVAFNHEAELLTGWTSKAIVGGSLMRIVPKDLQYDHTHAFDRASIKLLEGDAEWGLISTRTTDVQCRDGSTKRITLHIRGVRSGRQVLFIAVLLLDDQHE